MAPLFRDNEDKIVALLEQIAQQTAEDGPDSVSETVNITQNRNGPSQDGEPTYFSTGPDPVLVESTSFGNEITFGFSARMVNVRTTDDLVVTFKDPNKQGGHIPVAAAEAPFTIGNGEAGIDASGMWIKKADSATSDPEIKLLAYR